MHVGQMSLVPVLALAVEGEPHRTTRQAFGESTRFFGKAVVSAAAMVEFRCIHSDQSNPLFGSGKESDVDRVSVDHSLDSGPLRCATCPLSLVEPGGVHGLNHFISELEGGRDVVSRRVRRSTFARPLGTCDEE